MVIYLKNLIEVSSSFKHTNESDTNTNRIQFIMEEQNFMFKYKTSVYGKAKNSTFFNSSLPCPNTQNSNIN